MNSSSEKIEVYQSKPELCPYLHDRMRCSIFFQTEKLPAAAYEHLLDGGWRRCGKMFYLNTCPNCAECLPLRILVDEFKADRTQKRNLKKNADLRTEIVPAEFHLKDYELYAKYLAERHNDQSANEDDYRNFLLNSPVDSLIMRYYHEEQLVGVAWIDEMPKSISSVYFAFDGSFEKRSPGVFSILRQIELCKKLGKKFLHLGFYIKDCRKMNYKTNYSATELFDNNEWSKVNP